MAHQRPVCDCGELLVYEVDEVITFVRYKIKKDGTISKNPTVPIKELMPMR